MKTRTLKDKDISQMENHLLDEHGSLRILPYSEYRQYSSDDFSLFAVKHGFYALPTQELIDFLKEEIADKHDKTIEIGAGHGAISRSLGIKATDSFMQNDPTIKEYYESYQQATVPYGSHVEKIDANTAVKKYRPDIVIASWVTHKYNANQHFRGGNMYGVNEGSILEKVNKYVFVGNDMVHGTKPIYKIPHRTIKADWLISRATYQGQNSIYIWES